MEKHADACPDFCAVVAEVFEGSHGDGDTESDFHGFESEDANDNGGINDTAKPTRDKRKRRASRREISSGHMRSRGRKESAYV